jgi:hypothetical protein
MLERLTEVAEWLLHCWREDLQALFAQRLKNRTKIEIYGRSLDIRERGGKTTCLVLTVSQSSSELDADFAGVCCILLKSL